MTSKSGKCIRMPVIKTRKWCWKSRIRSSVRKTGGIVQGMSGAPIIQNGRLVGAVTHVLVNEPTKGYSL